MKLTDICGDSIETDTSEGTFDIYMSGDAEIDDEGSDLIIFELTKENAEHLLDELTEFLASDD